MANNSDVRESSKFAQRMNLSGAESAILEQVYIFVRDFFQNPIFDASHDFAHVERVTWNAIRIYEAERGESHLDALTILLGALMHDVEDKKYVDAAIPGESTTQRTLIFCGLNQERAHTIKKLVQGVSYSSEVKDPAAGRRRIKEIPELAIVQDADRLDAIGAVGVARCFTFGGAKDVRSLDDSIQHFSDKLLKLEGMMKTATGRRMAAERSERLRQYLSWWDAETAPRETD